MSLVNIKKFSKRPEDWLRYFLSLVFLSAGVFRIFNPLASRQELNNLQLPEALSILLIIFEIVVGLGLLLNKRTKEIYYGLIIFLTSALIWSAFISWPALIRQSSELFVFNLTPTDYFLHVTFLGVIIFLLSKKQANI